MNDNKEMLKLYRKVLTKVMNNRNNLHINIDFHARDYDYFSVTIFDIDEDNCTFYFYSHFTIEKLESIAKKMIAVIKTDYFYNIEKVCNEL